MKRSYDTRYIGIYNENFELMNYAIISVAIFPFNIMFSHLIALLFT
jgi:hypothetical protein